MCAYKPVPIQGLPGVPYFFHASLRPVSELPLGPVWRDLFATLGTLCWCAHSELHLDSVWYDSVVVLLSHFLGVLMFEDEGLFEDQS